MASALERDSSSQAAAGKPVTAWLTSSLKVSHGAITDTTQWALQARAFDWVSVCELMDSSLSSRCTHCRRRQARRARSLRFRHRRPGAAAQGSHPRAAPPGVPGTAP